MWIRYLCDTAVRVFSLSSSTVGKSTQSAPPQLIGALRCRAVQSVYVNTGETKVKRSLKLRLLHCNHQFLIDFKHQVRSLLCMLTRRTAYVAVV